jgi:predicted  nucleic acid-binding Zn-ribbon protein
MEELDGLADLLDLQSVDSEIDRLLQRRQSLPELEAYRAANRTSEGLDAQVRELEAQLEEGRLDIDKGEGELQLVEQKVEVEERRLFAGGLSARETEHLRLEVEMLRRRQSEMEDQVLAHLDLRDQLEERAAALRAELEAARAEERRLEEIISAEWRTIDAEIGRQEARKRDIVPLISDGLLELYEELRQTKQGVAVGRLAEGICGGCHLRLSAAEQFEMLRDSPPRCLHCRRILVPQ